jgi:hypothetical protein
MYQYENPSLYSTCTQYVPCDSFFKQCFCSVCTEYDMISNRVCTMYILYQQFICSLYCQWVHTLFVTVWIGSCSSRALPSRLRLKAAQRHIPNQSKVFIPTWIIMVALFHPSSGTLLPPISKYASISKYFEVLRYWSFFDIEVQHFDIEVQHFDIEATKKLRYRIIFDIEAACFDIWCQNLRASISKCMFFDIDIWILWYWSTLIEYRTLYRSTSISRLKNYRSALELNIAPDIEALLYWS